MVAFPRAALTLEMRQILARLLSAVSGGFRLVDTRSPASLRAARDTVQLSARLAGRHIRVRSVLDSSRDEG